MDNHDNRQKDLVRASAWPRSPSIDMLVARLARLPWWALIIFVGLVVTFYLMSSNEVYRRAFNFVTDSPRLTTNRIARVTYNVRQSDGSTQRVSGTLIDETNDSVTVITQDEVLVTVPRSDFTNLSCEADPTGANCPVGVTVTFLRTTASGALIFESLGAYTIQSVYGSEEIRKIAAFTETAEDTSKRPIRTPEGCFPDPNGNCQIQISLKTDREENTITGVLTVASIDALTVQVVPPITVTIPKADIVSVVNRVPAQCALNNLAGCDTGPFLTLFVTFGAFSLAIMIGLIFGLMRVSGNTILYNLSTVYVEVVRGIPLLVILLFIGFAVEPWFHQNFHSISPTATNIVGAIAIVIGLYYLVSRWSVRLTDPVELLQPLGFTLLFGAMGIAFVYILRERSLENSPAIRAIQAAIVGLAIGYGAFLAELFRAGIQSIGKGQMEAARSLGMSYVQAMRYIILPQAFRVILPPLGNDFIAMLKDTSLVAILAVPELTQNGRLFASSSYRVFETWITVGVLYLCMTLFLSFMVRVIERRTSLPR